MFNKAQKEALIKIADLLDKKGMLTEANEIDNLIKTQELPVLTVADLIKILQQYDPKTPVVVKEREGAKVPVYLTKDQSSISREMDSPEVEEKIKHDQPVLLLGDWQ